MTEKTANVHREGRGKEGKGRSAPKHWHSTTIPTGSPVGSATIDAVETRKKSWALHMPLVLA
jgi:hypothetical protein